MSKENEPRDENDIEDRTVELLEELLDAALANRARAAMGKLTARRESFREVSITIARDGEEMYLILDVEDEDEVLRFKLLEFTMLIKELMENFKGRLGKEAPDEE